MSIPAESLPLIEDTLNRLAAESILAQVGRDEGLIPAYSLLGELLEQASTQPEVSEPARALRDYLEKRLDNAMPFDEPGLAGLRKLVDWLSKMMGALRTGGGLAPLVLDFAASAAKPAPTSGKAVTVALDPSVDVVLDLNLEENRELLSEFRSEALDHLVQIEAALLTLDETPDDKDALNSIFRSFHTIKGVSGFLQLKPMHVLTHEVESLLDLARNGELRLNPTIITAILQSRDAVQAMVNQMSVALDKGQLPEEVVPVSHLIQQVKMLAANPESSTEAAGGTQAAHAEPPPVSPKAAPAQTKAEPPPAAASAAKEAVPVDTPIFMPQGVADEVKSEAHAVVAQAKPAASAKITQSAAVGSSSTVRVNTEKLDTLMDVVGELVIVQSQLVESARASSEEGSAMQRNVAQLGRITKELQHTAMSLRMVPVKPTFQKMERLARDLARDFGKKVHFVSIGEETEVDRTVVEEIGDPLVHMVRNSLDHGLEPAVERMEKGKPEMGRLELKAYHQGSNIIIELTDDGRGIDPDKILAKALKLNLASPNQQYAREEILNFIFLPGFSTAEKVTAVSGRGVGMDVVRRNIEKLRGKVEIESEVGKGTVFRIKLPLTMAIIDGLVVRVGNDRFILPSTSVQMALRPAREAFATVHGRGEVIDHRGRILPLHRLHRRFGIPDAVETPWEGIVVIIENNDRVAALLVDEMVSKQEVVIKTLGAFLHGLAGVAGGAILGDGSIALILDPASLLTAA
ncbi:chemotaxis protein CheA [mine drainage metagenome]|uniref:Chemotaxis protein CheA n=1 Tax=mine drainage metagenome TaxID=410659 RepID=A0A1J5SH47_9ZZZZ